MPWDRPGGSAAESTDEVVVKTTRYLRLGMVAMVAGLATSLLYEHFRHQPGVPARCWLGSISAYYYTPVQSFFVAALVTIGVALVCLKGNTEWEDVLLNFAGCLAPVVGFVSTPHVGGCGSVAIDPARRSLDIGNNVFALLVTAGLGLLVLVALVAWPTVRPVLARAVPDRWLPGRGRVGLSLSPIARGGFAAAVVAYLVVWYLFERHRAGFEAHAHATAANTMFGFIFLAVADNAVDLHRRRMAERRRTFRFNRYASVAAGMLLSVAVAFVLEAFTDFGYTTILLEASMIGLFAVFWLIQTGELWDQGLRSRTSG